MWDLRNAELMHCISCSQLGTYRLQACADCSGRTVEATPGRSLCFRDLLGVFLGVACLHVGSTCIHFFVRRVQSSDTVLV